MMGRMVRTDWNVQRCKAAVAGCRLSVVRCRLAVVGCRLSVAACRLLADKDCRGGLALAAVQLRPFGQSSTR